MIFTLENIINNLAGVLKAQYPDYPVYDSPNQQGTKYPCFFIFFMPSEISGQIDGRFLRDLGVDIVFVQQRNIVNGNKEIYEIADYLDEVLELFAYSDENGASGLIRTLSISGRTKIRSCIINFTFGNGYISHVSKSPWKY